MESMNLFVYLEYRFAVWAHNIMSPCSWRLVCMYSTQATKQTIMLISNTDTHTTRSGGDEW
jgi:uncharacterized protein YbdZ (MbtH family)